MMYISSSMGRQMSDDDAAIAVRIRNLRYRRGLSQTEVAEALGISFQQFQKYEQGRNRISAARLVGIARILGVTPHEILHWREEETEGQGIIATLVEDQTRQDVWESKEKPLHSSRSLLPATANIEPIHDAPCTTIDRKIADLWYRIRNDRTRRALVLLMETVTDERGLHPEVIIDPENQLPEVEK